MTNFLSEKNVYSLTFELSHKIEDNAINLLLILLNKYYPSYSIKLYTKEFNYYPMWEDFIFFRQSQVQNLNCTYSKLNFGLIIPQYYNAFNDNETLVCVYKKPAINVYNYQYKDDGEPKSNLHKNVFPMEFLINENLIVLRLNNIVYFENVFEKNNSPLENYDFRIPSLLNRNILKDFIKDIDFFFKPLSKNVSSEILEKDEFDTTGIKEGIKRRISC